MTGLEDHPHGQQCVNGLYATFDPNFVGMSFKTVPFQEDDDFVIWMFTADWLGTEDEEGVPVAAGLVSVSKLSDAICIYTWFPWATFSMILIPREG